jgi:hypothetical protein
VVCPTIPAFGSEHEGRRRVSGSPATQPSSTIEISAIARRTGTSDRQTRTQGYREPQAAVALSPAAQIELRGLPRPSVFLAHASEQKPLVEAVAVRLRGKVDVFFDQDSLPAGQSYADRIRAAVKACDLFVFFLSPASVSSGRFTLTELRHAQRRWDSPSNRVLPVMAEETDLELLPAYIRQLVVFRTVGEPSAEIVEKVLETVSELSPTEGPPLPNEAKARKATALPVIGTVVGVAALAVATVGFTETRVAKRDLQHQVSTLENELRRAKEWRTSPMASSSSATSPALVSHPSRSCFGCASDGKCTNGPNGSLECVATSDSDCRASQRCKNGGGCTAKDGACIAASDANCRESKLCKDEGRCTAREGECVAASGADCRASQFCTAHGKCSLREGQCVATNTDCRKSAACKSNGRCTIRDGVCAAVTDTDCRTSQRCRDYGKCTAEQGECIAASNIDCGKSTGCEKYGKCTAKLDTCIATTPAECQASRHCKAYGKCTAKNGECIVASNEDCRGFDGCKNYGKCTAEQGECVARSDSDCRTSVVCETLGMCTPSYGECIIGQ